jgi:putative transposase
MSQSLAKIFVHIIFSTKKRQPLILENIMQELHLYMVGIALAHGSHVHEIGGVDDHVHLLISLPRTISLSKLIENIKKGSSKWIKTKGNAFADFAWQNGYGAFSIGQSSYEALRKYIQSQKNHHKKISFQDEYRAFLQKYYILYDEKYIWD